MQIRGLVVATLVLFLGACRSDPPPKTDPPAVAVAPQPPAVEVQPQKKPAPIAPPAPKDPTPPVRVKVPPPLEFPPPIVIGKEPAKGDNDPKVPAKKPQEVSKDPKVRPKDPKDVGKEPPKFVVPALVLGKGFDAWRADFKSTDPTHREKAMKMILNFGTEKAYEALPDLLAELNRHKVTAPVDLSVRVNGVVAMSTILFGKQDPDKKLVDEAIAVFKTSLKDRQVILRTRSVQGVLCLGPRAQELIDEVISVAHDPTTSDVRKEGILTLTRLAVDADKKVHAKAPAELRIAVDDPAGQVKVVALQGIIAIAQAFDVKDKQLTVDKINALLKKKGTDPFTQMLGHVAIMNVTGKVDAANLNPLIRMLKDKDETHRAQALQFIKMFGSKAQPAIEELLVLGATAEKWEMRKEALGTATVLAYDKNGLHPTLLPALRMALNDKQRDVRQAALTLMALTKMQMEKADIKNCVAAVTKYLATEKEPLLVILGNVTVMTLLGEITSESINPIMDLLKHKEIPVRLEALHAISLGKEKSKPLALSAVKDTVRDPDLTVGVAAIDTLVLMHAFEATDVLQAIIADKKSDPVLVEAAREALVKLDEIRAESTKTDKSKDKAER